MRIEKNNSNNTARFVLWENSNGKNPVICFGVNPSSATSTKDDPTTEDVRDIAANNNFDGWIMLNLYPQRATKTKYISQTLDRNLHIENLNHIEDIFKCFVDPNPTVWAAWGNSIMERPFLKDCLKEIVAKIAPYSPIWVYCNQLTQKGHPCHPYWLHGYKGQFQPFDIDDYIK